MSYKVPADYFSPPEPKFIPVSNFAAFYSDIESRNSRSVASSRKGSFIVNVLRFVKTRTTSEEKIEQERINAAQQGDRYAFDALMRVYEPLLRGFLLRRVGQNAVDDVMQETLIAGWTALPNYTRQARFKAWLLAIATHKCTDYYRARGRTAQEIPLQEAEATSGTDGYAALDWKHAIQSAMARLPAEQGEVIQLYYYADLTLPEIAQALNRNLNTVKYQFYRAHVLVEQELNAAAETAVRLEKRKVPHIR